jgi:hypothetical protein
MSRFRNKQLYTDIFPEYKSALEGTEFRKPIQQPTQEIKQRFGEATPSPPAPLSREGLRLKKTLMSPPIQPTAKPALPRPPIQPTAKPDSPQTGNIPTTQTVSLRGYVAENKYDKSLHQETPKSQLELPLQLALKVTYPQNIQKYKDELERYNYYIDPLSDEEHVILYNPLKPSTSASKVIFGVRGTDVGKSADIFTDIGLAFTDIKEFDRYKKAEEKYKQVKSKFNDMPITLASHSLGGLISSVLAEPEDKIYTFNRPYLSYPIRKNEVAISVETDPLLNTLNAKGSVRGSPRNVVKQTEDLTKKPIIIPRTYYSKAKDYLEVEKAKVNPNYEQKEIKIPEEYKTDLPNIFYQNVIQGAYPAAYLGYQAYEKYIKKPQVYRQQLLTTLQDQTREQIAGAQRRIGRVSATVAARALPRTTSTSPRALQKIEQALARPLTNIEQNTLNPSILDTTKRTIQQIIRNPREIGYNVLTSPPIQYAALNLAGGYVANRAIDSHSIENLPLKIRIE